LEASSPQRRYVKKKLRGKSRDYAIGNFVLKGAHIILYGTIFDRVLRTSRRTGCKKEGIEDRGKSRHGTPQDGEWPGVKKKLETREQS